jgi:hypothetical protein
MATALIDRNGALLGVHAEVRFTICLTPPTLLERAVIDSHEPLRSAPTNETAITHLSDDRLCQAWRVKPYCCPSRLLSILRLTAHR